MTSSRPKRSRKIVNYGEDHLHWIEETQIQKALLRSLYDKESPSKRLFETETAQTETVKNKLLTKSNQESGNVLDSQKQSASATKCSDIQISRLSKTETNNTAQKQRKLNKSTGGKSKIKDVASRPEENFELRLTRLQSKLLEEHGIFDPAMETSNPTLPNIVTHKKSSVCHVELQDVLNKESVAKNQSHSTVENVQDDDKQFKKTPRKKLFPTGDGPVDSDSEQSGETSNCPPRVRAQRKFASNASPPHTRSCSPVKMHRNKPSSAKWNENAAKRLKRKRNSDISSMTTRAMRACSSESEEQSSALELASQKWNKKSSNNSPGDKSYPPSVLDVVPKTDTFLSYLCFRNTKMSFNISS